MLTFTVVMFSAPSYGEYIFPWWANGIGWLFALCSLMAIPITMVLQLLTVEGSFLQVDIYIMLGTIDQLNYIL